MPRYVVTADNREFDIHLEPDGERFGARINGKPRSVTYTSLQENRFLMLVDHESFEVDVRSGSNSIEKIVFMNGQEIPVSVESFHLAQARRTAGVGVTAAIERNLRAPMPGLILRVNVTVGQRVTKGQPLLIIEAMKMENIVKAKSDALVSVINVTAGRSVEKGDTLMEFDSDGH